MRNSDGHMKSLDKSLSYHYDPIFIMPWRRLAIEIELEQAGGKRKLKFWRHNGLESCTFFSAMTKFLDDILRSVSRCDEKVVKVTNHGPLSEAHITNKQQAWLPELPSYTYSLIPLTLLHSIAKPIIPRQSQEEMMSIPASSSNGGMQGGNPNSSLCCWRLAPGPSYSPAPSPLMKSWWLFICESLILASRYQKPYHPLDMDDHVATLLEPLRPDRAEEDF